MLPDRLDAFGIGGEAVGRLQRDGTIAVGGQTITVEDVSERRPGQHFAFVMDTGLCDGAVTLADRADLFVCESTFLDSERDLAASYRHLTARQAAEIAREARARRLVLTHFSQRYPNEDDFLQEARAVFDDVVAARDLMTVSVPTRV
jgi:ribonuclease Z